MILQMQVAIRKIGIINNDHMKREETRYFQDVEVVVWVLHILRRLPIRPDTTDYQNKQKKS